ncbi:MAG TPA: hypothetical protein VHO25_11125 [Polyangiaceae bacterium]|nr:hypothetical protein [Polyangiaceae bacterium]
MTKANVTSILLVLLLLIGCAPTEPPTQAPGKVVLALSANTADGEYRVLGTIRVIDEAGDVVESIEADEDSPPTHVVDLLPGQYTVEVVAGYSCIYSGPLQGFTGCEYLNALPSPFDVVADETTRVTLRFLFSFDQDDDVTVLFQTGAVEISLEADAAVSHSCGGGAGCQEGEICASLEDDEARCYAPCAPDGTCGPGEQCKVFGTADGEVVDLCIPATCMTLECAEDTTPPVLEDLSFSATTLDATMGNAQLTVTATVSDDLSGFNYGFVRFRSPSGGQFRSCSFSASSGGICTVTFPQFGEGGTWFIDYGEASDLVGNWTFWNKGSLEVAGFPTEVEVLSDEDTAPPMLEAFSFSPTSIDTTVSNAQVTVTATLSDDVSGFNYGFVRFRSPSGGQFRSCSFSASSGGICTVTFPQFGEGGTWFIDYGEASDLVGNWTFWNKGSLEAAGFSTELEVNGG